MVAGIIFPCVLIFSGDISQGRPWGHPQKGHARKDAPFGNVPVPPLAAPPRLISRFFVLINFMVKSHGLLVLVSSIRYRTYTPSLSNT